MGWIVIGCLVGVMAQAAPEGDRAAPPGLVAGLRLRVVPEHLTSGAGEALVTITCPAPCPGVGVPSLAVSHGTIERARRVAPDRFEARLRAPGSGPPARVAISAALVHGGQVLAGAQAIPLASLAAVELITAPGALVELSTQGETYGPRQADAAGHVTFMLRVSQPSFAYQYRISLPGLEPVVRGERVEAPPLPPPLVIGPALPGVFAPVLEGPWLIVARPELADSALDRRQQRAPPACRLASETTLPVQELAPGLWAYRLPVVLPDGSFAVTCRDSDGRAQTAVLETPPALAARLVVAAPAVFVAGQAAATIRISAQDDQGRLVALPPDSTLHLALDGRTELRSLELALAADGPEAIATVDLPASFGGAARVDLTARGGGLSAASRLPLVAAAPARLTLDGLTEALAADGRSRLVLSATATDRFGNTVSDLPAVRVRLGSLALCPDGRSWWYEAPLLGQDATETVTLTLEELTSTVPLRLRAVPVVSAALGGGLLLSQRGAAAPLAQLAIGVEHRRVGAGLTLLAARGLARALGDGSIAIRTHWQVLAATAGAAWHPALGDDLRAILGAGLGVAAFDTVVAFGGVLDGQPEQRHWLLAPQLAGRVGLAWPVGSWELRAELTALYMPPLPTTAQTLCLGAVLAYAWRWGW